MDFSSFNLVNSDFVYPEGEAPAQTLQSDVIIENLMPHLSNRVVGNGGLLYHLALNK